MAALAADRARAEILPRFRNVAVEVKSDGSPVTEADHAAERAIRAVLSDAYPEHAILGEEGGGEEVRDGLLWVVDPIDGTLGFARGIPLFSTIIALLEDGEPQLGLIDLPALDERMVGYKGGGCRRNGVPVEVSQADDLKRALVSISDAFCFKAAGLRRAYQRINAEIPFVRTYTDAFGHAQVLGGSVDAMVDVHLNPWDIAATRILVPEAGGRCVCLKRSSGKYDAIFGSPPLVERLTDMLET